MPKIKWANLTQTAREHLLDRMRVRELSQDDVWRLAEWVATNPEAPDGPWHKDFGTFKLCGEGERPTTFLRADQSAWGKKL